MKLKYTGDQDEIRLRGVTFAKGEAVELSDKDPEAVALAQKCLALDYFSAVKAGRPKKVKADGDSA